MERQIAVSEITLKKLLTHVITIERLIADDVVETTALSYVLTIRQMLTDVLRVEPIAAPEPIARRG